MGAARVWRKLGKGVEGNSLTAEFCVPKHFDKKAIDPTTVLGSVLQSPYYES